MQIYLQESTLIKEILELLMQWPAHHVPTIGEEKGKEGCP